MAKIETSIVIDRPVDEVFALVSNVENNPKWSAAFIEAKKTSAGPIGVGTTWRSVGKLFGQRIEQEEEYTEYEPNRKITIRSKSGPFPVQIWQTFQPVESGTRISIDGTIEPGGFFKLAEPLFANMMKRSVEADLANLKDLMEAHAL